MRKASRVFCWALGAFAAAGLSAYVRAGDIVDATGRTITVAAPVTRIAVAGPPAEVLISAFAPEAMVGRFRDLSPRLAPFLSPEARALPTLEGITIQNDAAQFDKIIAAKPQLIIDYGDIDPRYIKQATIVQEDSGIPYVLLDGKLEKTPATLRALGKLTGHTARGEELAVYAEKILARAKAIGETYAAKPATVYIARSTNGTATTVAGLHSGDVYDLAGLKNVSDTRNATLDQIKGWDPDVIISVDAPFMDTVKTAPWTDLRAVKNGRVLMTPLLPWGWTDHPPSVNRLIGVLWLTSKVYGQPSAAELKDETVRFYKTFFRIDLTAQQLAELLP